VSGTVDGITIDIRNLGGSNAGTISCLAAGHLTALAAHVYSVTFQSYGRLGQCPGIPIDGKINLCR
jgi:hypothetical protein